MELKELLTMEMAEILVHSSSGKLSKSQEMETKDINSLDLENDEQVGL